MRIRRRPSVSPSGESAPQIRTQNGGRGSGGGAGGAAAAAAGEGLHPVGDLLLRTESGKISNPSSSSSDPRRLAPPFPASPELPQEEEEEEEEDGDEEMEVDSNERCSTGINGSNTSAVTAAPSWEMAASPRQTHARGGSDGRKGSGGAAEAKPAAEGERKEKMRARASSASGSSSNCTGEGSKEGRDVGSGKRRRSAAALMEGSRCSRVNGRGWRCCQQTLVGYSLCEHHLGKGRLRSVASVRGQLGTSKSRWIVDESNCIVPSTSPDKNQPPPPPASASGITGANRADEEEEEDTARRSTRKKKAGTVKARSISSLLDDLEVSPAAAATAAPPREQLMKQ